MDLATLSPHLTKSDAGIWSVEGSALRSLSFPEHGHEALFRLEDESFWFQHRNECIIRALDAASFEAPLLDMGAGNGAVSAALQRHGISTVVLEPGPEGANNAVKRGLSDVVCATLDDAGFAAGSFGAVGAFDVIEHIEDDLGILRSIHRVLKSNGVLCVTVPAFQWLWSAEDELAGHFRRYSLSDLRRLLREASFDVTYETYFFAPLTLPVFVMRALRHRLTKRSEESVQRSAERDHESSPGGRNFAQLALRPELEMISRRRTIPVGTSCLVVAKKRS